MIGSDDLRCPDCGTTDLIVIHTAAIDDELLECRGCMKLYQLGYEADGTTAKLVPR